jgi:hypothetical protein
MALASILWAIGLIAISLHPADAVECHGSSPTCNSTFERDDSVCTVEEFFKANFTETVCSIEDWNQVSFIEDDGTCLLDDLFSEVSGMQEYTEDVCPLADIIPPDVREVSEELCPFRWSLFKFDEFEENDDTCWSGNYFDADSQTCKRIPDLDSLTTPTLGSFSPSEGFREKQNQLITVRINNFPAFFRQYVSVTVSTHGTSFNQSVNFEIPSDDIIILRPEAPNNNDSNDRTFVISVRFNLEIEWKKDIVFNYTYKKYFIGAPANMDVSPRSVYVGDIFNGTVKFSNFNPIQQISNEAVSAWGYDFRLNATYKILKNTSDEMEIEIMIGKMKALGNYYIKICTNDSDSNYVCANSDNISVIEPPAPTTLRNSILPKSVSAGNLSQTLQFEIQYLSPLMDRSHLIAKLRTRSGQMILLKFINSTSLAADCQDIYRFCARDQVTFQLPPGGNPDGVSESGTYEIEVELHNTSIGRLTFRYISVTAPGVRFVSRRSMVLPVSSNAERITVQLQYFPSISCDESCFLQLPQTTEVKFGTVQTNFTVKSLLNQVLIMELDVPEYGKAGTVQVVIVSTSSVKTNVSFDFEFIAPLATVYPVDGLTLGGTVVTITAFGWGDLEKVSVSNLSQSQINVSFDENRAEVLTVVEAISYPKYMVKAIVRTPAKRDNSTGNVRGRIGLTGFEASFSLFDWHYFETPEILNANPEMATVGGFTGTEEGNTTVLSIKGFPRVRLRSSLNVVFRIQGTSTVLNTSILSFSNSLNVLRLTVFVPSANTAQNSSATIQVLYNDLSASFSIRTAILDSFRFFVPRTEVKMARWCAECNRGAACILNGRCAKGETPLNNQAGLMEAGILVVMFTNVYIGVSVATPDLALLFGKDWQSTSQYSRISSSFDQYGHYATVVAEFSIPALSGLDCNLTAFVNSTVSPSLLDGFVCVNRSISIVCQRDNGTSIPCAGPSNTSFDFVARISGLSSDLIRDSVLVNFGDSAPLVFNVTKAGPQTVLVRISLPPFTVFSGSSATVDMLIRQDNSVLVSTRWEIWNAPSIASINFNTMGNQVQVRFDQATDRGGLAIVCNSLLANEVEFFGSGFSCVWTDSKLMTITLGRGASAKVDDALIVIGQRLKSENGLSLLMPTSSERISLPEIVQIPRIQVWGPTTIDSCSSLSLLAKGVSPRALSFSWSCSNDENLNRYLSTRPANMSSLNFGSATPEMEALDKTYVISVVATDFMGLKSEPATLRILKKGSASPQFVFSPPLHEISRNKPILIKGDAEFSECPVPREAMMYTWRRASGPALTQGVFNRVQRASGPQLFLPANSLEAGQTYTFALMLSIGGDITKSSESMVTVIVNFQPVVAKISGGGSFLFSILSGWELDATPSVDPDDTIMPAPLSFNWNCYFSDGIARSPCTDVNGSNLVLQNKPLLQIESNTLAPTDGTPYLFSVSVQDSAMRKSPDTVVVAVRISSAPVIPVDLELLSASGFRGSNVIVNSDNRAVFYGRCSFKSGGVSREIKWDIKPSNANTQALIDDWNGIPYLIVTAGSGVFQAGLRYSITVHCSETIADGTTIAGTGSIDIDTNEPPSGGGCSVCLLGPAECRKSGSPIVDTFRVSCVNWADQDIPLQYRFGFSSGNKNIFWTAYRSTSFIDVVFPYGSIEVFAQVQDSFGETAPVIDVTLGDGLQIGIDSSRRLLSSGIDWDAALGKVQELAAKQDSKGMNSLIGSMALQLSFEYDENKLNPEKSKRNTHLLLRAAEQALSYAVKTTDNVCESFSVVQKLASKPEILGLLSAMNASSIVKDGVVDQSIDQSVIEQLDQTCTASALDIFNDIRSALRNISEEEDSILQEKTFLQTEQNAIASLVHLYSKSLTSADMPLDLRNSMTFNTISRMDQAKLGKEISFAVDEYVSRNSSTVSFSLPQKLISALNVTDDGLNVHASASSYAPASSGLLIRSPVVGLTLSRPKSRDPISVSGLSEAINISIPFQAMPEASWTNFSQQVQCMFWDPVGKAYSSDGVKVSNVTKTYVVCQSSHLTDFVLNQNLSISVVPAPPGPQKTDSTTPQTIDSTTNAGIPDQLFSFEGMLKVVGDRSGARAIAKMPWQSTNISLSQSNRALELALRSAGGFGVPCTASVPFLALPGLVLSTVKGITYPRDFAIAIETMRPSLQNHTLVSAVTKFSMVNGSTSGFVQIIIEGFALSQTRRSSACMIGTEWRYQKLGLDEYFACSCAANDLCKDETVCEIAPSSGDRWAVGAVSTALCATSSDITQTSDQSLALGLGLGLGLGLPLTAGTAYALFLLFLSKQKAVKSEGSGSRHSPQSPSLQSDVVSISERPGSQILSEPSRQQGEVLHSEPTIP